MFNVTLNSNQQKHKGKIIFFSENISFKRSKLNQRSRGNSEGYIYTCFSLKFVLHMKDRVEKEQWQAIWCSEWEPGIRSQKVWVLMLMGTGHF